MEPQITALPIFCPKVFNIACALDVKLQELNYDDVHNHIFVIDHETNAYRILTEDAFKAEFDVAQGLLIPTYMATKR